MSDRAPVPPSVQLGEVVPPEDPEDWGQPLTWVLAAGLLAAPVTGLVWVVAAPPADPAAGPGTAVLAAVLAVGAAVTGATQRGARRSLLTTVGAGLFGALSLTVVGSAVAGGTAIETAAFAALAGVLGSIAAAVLAALLSSADRARRYLSPAVAGALVAAIASELLVRG